MWRTTSHILYGRSDKRGDMLVEVMPKETLAHFIGLDDVRDAKSKVPELAAFCIVEGVAGAERVG